MPDSNKQFLSLDLLPALEALLETRSVTRAAERLGISQPTMSRLLARLRREFGDPLLVRTGNRWDLTHRALDLREPLRELLRTAEGLYAPPRFDPGETNRTFRMAIPDVVGAALLPMLYAAVARAAPHCALIVVPWPRAEESRDVDLAIGTEAGLFPTFRMEPLFDDFDQLAFRLADGPPPLSEQLSRPHVAVVPVGFQRDLVDDWLAANETSRRIAMVVPNYLQALHIVAKTGLLAILPSRLLATVGSIVGVGSTPVQVPQEPDRQWLLYPPRLHHDPGNVWLRRTIREVVTELSRADSN